MARRTDKVIERERAYWNGELVTILKHGRRKSDVRRRGFVHEDVPNSELDFGVEDDRAVLRFEPPSG